MMFGIGTVSVIFFLLTMVLFLRGQEWHAHLVETAKTKFLRAGCDIRLEYPMPMVDGRINYVDLWVSRGDCQFVLEVETSARHVLDNAIKADAAGMRLWVLVPNRRVKKAVRNKLRQVNVRPGGLAIYILLLDELEQAVTNIFPLISAANSEGENKKQTPFPEQPHAHPMA